jgi:hypothetical protein
MKARQKSSLPPLAWAIVWAAVALAPQVAGAASLYGHYVLPLPNEYCIYVSDGGDETYLAKRRNRIYSSVSSVGSEGPTEVIKYAVSGDTVFGTTPEGYFILDTRQGLAEEVERLHLFTEVPAWRAKLAELDVLLDYGSLRRPDAVAQGLTEQDVRPWFFEQMRGSWGLSDADWGFLVAGFGLAGCFALGVLVARQVPRRAGAAALGFASAFAGPFIIGGGGPVGCLALVASPFLGMLAAEVGLSGRRALGRALARLLCSSDSGDGLSR